MRVLVLAVVVACGPANHAAIETPIAAAPDAAAAATPDPPPPE